MTAKQGCGFSEVIASLESELRSMEMAHKEVTQDNKGCYNLIRAKDRELDAAAVHLEQARAVMVENKASPIRCSTHRASSRFCIFQESSICLSVYAVNLPLLSRCQSTNVGYAGSAALHCIAGSAEQHPGPDKALLVFQLYPIVRHDVDIVNKHTQCTADQELQNSILDLTRRLQEAADNRTTLLTVQRQLNAEVARAQGVAAAAKDEAACKGRELASTQTLLKVNPSTGRVKMSLFCARHYLRCACKRP